MKRVIYILEAVEGGAWRHLRDLINALHGRLFDCAVVLSFERNCGNPDEIRSFLAARDVPLYEIPMKRSAAPGDMASVLKLTKLLRRLKPELLHAHSAKAGVLGRLAARLSGVPSVYTPHCFPFLMKGERLSNAYELIEKGVVGISPAIIVISREEHEAARRLGYPEDRIHYIANGIAPCGLGFPDFRDEEPLRLGFFGREGLQKGADSFVRLVEELNRLGFSAEGVLYGAGSSECDPASLSGLHRTSRTLDSSVNEKSGKGNYVRMCGICAQEQVTEVMRGCDVIVMPSRWEGLPYVMLEALDAGVPVCAYKVGGIADIVEHGLSAMLAEPEDFNGLMECVMQLRDADLRRRIAEGGREAVKPYTLARMAEATAGVYEGVLI